MSYAIIAQYVRTKIIDLSDSITLMKLNCHVDRLVNSSEKVLFDKLPKIGYLRYVSSQEMMNVWRNVMCSIEACMAITPTVCWSRTMICDYYHSLFRLK